MPVVQQTKKLTSDENQEIANKTLAPSCSVDAEQERPADTKTTLTERDSAIQLTGFCWENDT